MNDESRPEPAERLQLARERAGYASARSVAERFGWSYHTYIQHENGTRGLSRAAKEYAIALKVSEAWLLTGVGPGPDGHAEELATLSEIYGQLPAENRADLLRFAEILQLAAQVRAQNQEASEE